MVHVPRALCGCLLRVVWLHGCLVAVVVRLVWCRGNGSINVGNLRDFAVVSTGLVTGLVYAGATRAGERSGRLRAVATLQMGPSAAREGSIRFACTYA